MKEIYCLAEKKIAISSIHEYVHRMCRNYISSGPADFTVSITEEDIAFERKQSDIEAEAEGRSPVSWKDPYLETLAVYRKIAENMPRYDTFLFHGSAVSVDNQAYIFTARSGTGKSTHVRLWRQLFGERAVMVNDDKPLIRIGDDNAFVYGTPWDGKHHLSNNICVPIKAICILERGETNRIVNVEPSGALPVLLQQTYRPDDAPAMLRTLSLLDGLMKKAKLYRLQCNMDPEAAVVSYEGMQ